ncbi:MAG: hypothetical protein EB120_00880 [Proteobacteria bacterium]|nr:hypothetical protein [Pseudomonadota bacterium]
MKEIAKNSFISVLSIFAPIKMVILTVGVLILADLMTGIFAARKRGEKITSAALGRTVVKMCVYQTVILTGYLLQTNLLENMVPVVNIVGSVIGMVEFKSLIENSNTILGMNLFEEVLAKLGSKNLMSPKPQPEKSEDSKK